MNSFTVYLHRTPSNKVYVGMTQKSVKQRWGTNGNGYKTQQLFWRAIQKYGWENIQHEIIADNLSKEEACELETALIAKYQSNNCEFGYNISAGGDIVQLGLKRTAEQIKHISDGHKGIPLTEGQIAALERNHKNQIGKPRPEEVKQKISAANKGRVRSEQQRRNISEAQKKRTDYKTGYHLSNETKEKLRQANIGKALSEQTKKKISDNHARYWLGKTRSEETKQKISESLTGKESPLKGTIRSDEFKKKCSESQKKRLQGVDLSGERNGFYGKHHSPETIEKIRRASIENARKRREKKLLDEAEQR